MRAQQVKNDVKEKVIKDFMRIIWDYGADAIKELDSLDENDKFAWADEDEGVNYPDFIYILSKKIFLNDIISKIEKYEDPVTGIIIIPNYPELYLFMKKNENEKDRDTKLYNFLENNIHMTDNSSSIAQRKKEAKKQLEAENLKKQRHEEKMIQKGFKPEKERRKDTSHTPTRRYPEDDPWDIYVPKKYRG